MYKILYNIFMKVGVYCNRSAKKFIPIREELFRCLKERQIIPRICDSIEQVGDVDILIVLGGDGTILRAALDAGRRGIRLLGINAGTLGFLSEFEGEQVKEAVDLLCGEFETEKRSVLQVDIGTKTYYALNDAVFQRSYNPSADDNVVDIHVRIDGKVVDNFIGDGVIVSTPTGSTAYSLSAGGSILTPGIAAFILTPVCAHSLHNRPIVYADSSKLEIRAEEGPGLSLYCDGRFECTLKAQDTATLKKAEFCVEFIKRKDSNFFDKLLLKLTKWSK